MPSELGHKALKQLLSRATERLCVERLGVAASSVAVVHIGDKSGQINAYRGATSASVREAFNAELEAAAQSGAVELRIGDRHNVVLEYNRVTCVDADRLAAFLNVTPYWTVVEKAAARLIAVLPTSSKAEAIVASWWEQKPLRGLGPEKVGLILDAHQTLQALGSIEIPVRRLSARLFGDSKHIEEHLGAALDYLSGDGLSIRNDLEVLAALGLVRFAPTVLLSNASVRLRNGFLLGPVYPYLGVAAAEVERVDLSPEVRTLLTVENQTTFHELSRQGNSGSSVACLYTAGMPSRSIQAVYGRILACASPTLRVLHWGDVDLGGFRIADRLAAIAKQHSRTLDLWQMPPPTLPKGYRPLAHRPGEAEKIQKITQSRGWGDAGPVRIEQEVLDPMIPPSTTG